MADVVDDGFVDDRDDHSPAPSTDAGPLLPEAAAQTTHATSASLDDEPIELPPSPIARLVSTLKTSRKHQLIAGGAAGLLVIVMALAFCGGGSADRKTTQVAAHEPTATPTEPTTDPTHVSAKPDDIETPTPTESAPAAQPTDRAPAENNGPTAEELAAAAEMTPTDEAATPNAATTNAGAATANTGGGATTGGKPAGSSKGTLGGKQVVLEYDAQAQEAKPVASAPRADQAAIQKARAAYAAGNKSLFAGDPAGAIRYYRQSLAYYPGYVAGYRGLGLAYERQGDRANALKALRQYVASVPGAKDAPLIVKRIKSLSAK